MNYLKMSRVRLVLLALSAMLLAPAMKAAHCYFILPDDWATPCVWAWDDNDANCCANQIWPGDEMTLVDAEKHLYHWEAPAGKTPTWVIIVDKANQNGHRMKGENSVPDAQGQENGDTPFVDGATYAVDSSWEIINYPIGNPVPEPDPEPSEPSEAAVCYFIRPDGWGVPCVWAWDDNNVNCCTNKTWPGDEMKLIDASKNLYRWTAPAGMNPAWVIIVDKGNNSNRMYGENSIKTDGDTPFVAGATYTVDSSWEIITYPIGDPDPDPEPDPDPVTPQSQVYFYFENTSNWASVYAWVWSDETGNCCEHQVWPGDQLKLVDATKKLYLWEAQAGYYPQWVIIHDNGSNRMKGANSINTNGDTPFLNGVTYKPDSTHEGEEIPVNDPANTAGAVTSWSEDGTTVTVECESARLFITPYADEVVKVFTLVKDATGEERPSISVAAAPSVSFMVEEAEDAIRIIVGNGQTIVSVNRENGIISFLDADGNLKLREKKYLRNLGVSHSVSFEGMNDAAFFGAGYNGKWGSIKGHAMRLDNTQTGGWGQERFDYPHCITIPFAASTSGYGVLFDDHWRGAVMTPGENGLSYTSGAQNPISYYYVGGGNLDEVIANYTILTGRQDLPPYWAFGYITSRYGYHSQAEAQGYINDIKNAGLPLDGIVFDLYWEGEDESGMGNLDWYTPNFPNATKMLADWKAEGINTILITEPFFTSRCTNYQELKDKGYFADDDVSNMSWLKSEKVGLLDASNPEALDWMWQFYRDRTKEGITGWWMDLGEPEQHDADSNHKGGSVSQVHNEFGLNWIERIYNGFREEFPEMRPFLMPRSGTAGMQRYSTFPWTGDILRSWGGLAAQVPALINMAMSGVSYTGSDIGGFTASSTDPSLYLRWVEFGVFSPMMRTHSTYKPEPTHSEYSGVLNDVRRFINLRYQFLPYTYTQSYLNTSAGLPIARPACAFDANPSTLADCNDAYLWGKDIYVAPVLSNASSRSITFPEGEWIDFNDYSKVYSGGESVNYSAPLEKLPYFMRRGSFIPMFTKSENFGSTSEISYEDITVIHSVDLSKSGNYSGILYEDDRTSAGSLENEEFTVIEFTSQVDSDGKMEITCQPQIGNSSHFMPETRTIRLHILGYNGEEVPELTINTPESQMLRGTTKAKIEKADSREAADAHSGHAYYQDENSMYIKTVMPATASLHVGLGLGTNGIEAPVMNDELIALEYVDGTVNYSVPASMGEATIEFVAIDGRVIGRVAGLKVDGLVHSVAVPAEQGFCIGRLTAGKGNSAVTKTIKMAL